ncbi:MAG: tetratricopeptide repeat protein [Pseudomonadota bacterium]
MLRDGEGRDGEERDGEERDLRSVILLCLVPVSALLCLTELSTFQLGKAVLVGPLLAVLLVGGGTGAGWLRRPVLGAALCVILFGVLALLHSPSPGVGAWELWLDLLFLGAVIAGTRLGTNGPGRVLVGIAGAGAALVVVTALEAVGVGPLCPAAVSKAGTMGNPNFTGAVLALAAPASLALALDARRGGAAAAWSGLALAGLGAIASLGSWTGAIGAGLGLAAVGIHALVRRGRPRIALAVGLLLLFTMGGALTSEIVRGHLADRWYMARVSASAASEEVLAGHGLGGFPRAFMDAQAGILERSVHERGRWTRALHAHSEPMHAFVERGLGGLLAWLTLWIAIGWILLRRAGVPGITGVLVAGFSLSLGEFPGHLVPVQLALGLAVGGAVLGGNRPVDGPPTGRVGAEAPPTGDGWRHLVWLLAIPLFLVPPWLALSDRALNRGDPAEALRINPWNGHAAFAVALAEQDGTAPTGCAHARLGEQLLPSPASAMALGLCAARRSQLEEGIAALRRAARWNPRNASAHANLAILLLEAGDLEGARSHAIRAASLRPGDPRIQRIIDVVPDPTIE